MDFKDPTFLFPPPEVFEKAERLAKRLTAAKLTVASAESLTSGLISAVLTSFPGSSKYFLAGVTTYSNEAKHDILKVPWEIIILKGAVSPECSRLMAAGARELFKSDLGVSTTGIAGPTGATPKKPTGLVYLTVTGKYETITQKFDFKGNRHDVVTAATLAALKLLKKYMERHYPDSF
jgi:nicotinamide-nucleotide amidase